MPFRSTGLSRPTAWASVADFCSEDATGSIGEGQVLPGRLDERVLERLARGLLDLGVGHLLGLGRVLVDELVGRHLALEQALDHVGVLLEELGGDDEVRGDVLAVGPQVTLVDQDLAAALGDQAGRPRLGHPGAVDLAVDEGLQRLRVLLGDDRRRRRRRRCRS